MKIICRIKDLRKEQKLTQEDLAERLGISRQSIISVESGKCIPSLILALGMANLFQKNIEDIFEFENKLNNPSNSFDFTRDKSFGGKEQKMSRELLPFRPMGLGRFFDDDMDMDLPKFPQITMPAMDVYEKNGKVIVECQLPGIDPEQVKIDVVDNTLKISGEKREEREEKDKNYYHREISYGTFSRSVVLPTKVAEDKAEADYSNGMLKITLPKIEQKQAKTIKIKVGKKR